MKPHQSLRAEVNIGDVVRLALPVKSAVLANGDQLWRVVKWIVFLAEWRSASEQIQQDDLAILPRSVQRRLSAADAFSLIRRLDRRGAAGLLLFSELPDTETLVEETRLPILLCPPGSSERETHQAIVALIIDRQTAIGERGTQLYRLLSEMSREGKGVDAMTEAIAQLTGKTIIVQDKRLEVRAISSPGGMSTEAQALFDLLGKREQLPAVLRNRKAAARASQSHWQQLLPIENMGRLISPIVSGDRARGYLSVVGPADGLDMLDSLAAEQGAAALALEMAKAKAVSEVRKALRGDFLEGLLAGSLPRAEIERLSGRLDHDTRPPHAVLTFAWKDPSGPSLRRLESAVSWLVVDHARPALVHLYGDQHVCVFQSLEDDQDLESASSLADRVRRQLATEFPGEPMIGGMSGPAASLNEWPVVYGEAVQAMQLGKRLGLNHVVEFRTLGVYRLLGKLESDPLVRDFTQRVIGPLVAYDRDHRSNLVLTIDAYFKHHGNISQTAESLFIHRNTLLYRLERIKELTKHDLSQANMRLALHLALKFWQLKAND
jgi:purine catabolism regulator